MGKEFVGEENIVIKGFILAILFKLRLINVPVSDIHQGYLRGEMTFDKLCEMLRAKQMEEFIEYHEKVKEEFDDASNKGLDDLDEMSDEFREIIESNPEIRTLFESQLGFFLGVRDRNRIFCALMQLDNFIEKGMLEQRIKGKDGVNIVRRM